MKHLPRDGFPGGAEVKNSPANAGNARKAGAIPGLGRSPGEGNGNPLQYSCLENPMDEGAWWATVHRVTKSQTRLSDLTFTFILWHSALFMVQLSQLYMTLGKTIALII